MSIHPVDALLMATPGHRPRVRTDDVVDDIVRVRQRQDQLAERLVLPRTPDLSRMRECADIRSGYAEPINGSAIRIIGCAPIWTRRSPVSRRTATVVAGGTANEHI